MRRGQSPFSSIVETEERARKINYLIADISMLQKASTEGISEAQYHLARRYKHGIGGARKNFNEAMRLYRCAAEQGHILAKHELAFGYDEGGPGVAQNKQEALRWYEKAALEGYVGSQCNLSLLYSKGDGVDRDMVQAAKWAKCAAKQGSVPSQFNYGLYCYNGTGVEQNLKEAKKWFTLAASSGHRKALNGLSLIERSMNTDLFASSKKQKFIEISQYGAAIMKRGRPGEDFLYTRDLKVCMGFAAVNDEYILLTHIEASINTSSLAHHLSRMGGEYNLSIIRNKEKFEFCCTTQGVDKEIFGVTPFLTRLKKSLEKLSIPSWGSLEVFDITGEAVLIGSQTGLLKEALTTTPTKKPGNFEFRKVINFLNYCCGFSDNTSYTNASLDLQYDLNYWTDVPDLCALAKKLISILKGAPTQEKFLLAIKIDGTIPEPFIVFIHQYFNTFKSHVELLNRFNSYRLTSSLGFFSTDSTRLEKVLKYFKDRRGKTPSPEVALRRASAGLRPSDDRSLESQEEIVNFLITKVENIDATGPVTGMTALHQAVINVQIGNVKILLASGARYDIFDKKGKTSKDYALESSQEEILACFQENSIQL